MWLLISWYFYTHRQNTSGMCACAHFVMRVNTHTVDFFLVSISMGCFIVIFFLLLLLLLLFTHDFPATFHSSVFLSSTTWPKIRTIFIHFSTLNGKNRVHFCSSYVAIQNYKCIVLICKEAIDRILL